MNERPTREIRGETVENEKIVTTISPPVLDAATGDWVCTVRCPALLDRAARLTGADRAHAQELAETFVRLMFRHHAVRET